MTGFLLAAGWSFRGSCGVFRESLILPLRVYLGIIEERIKEGKDGFLGDRSTEGCRLLRST